MKFKNFLLKSNSLGKLIILVGVLILMPLSVLVFFPEELEYALAFLLSSLFSIILGASLCFGLKRDNDRDNHWKMTMQHGYLTVFLAWVYAFVVGAVPFVLANQLSFSHAFFESVSGWTTTGLSLIDVEVSPKIFLFHRSFMQFCGGLGFVMVMTIFVYGKQSMNLYTTEGHQDMLMPNLKKSARAILIMYLSLLIIGTTLYALVGMPLFDSLMHAMSALSTGGFSTQTESIGYYNNLGIEIITLALMVLGTTNFAILMLLCKRKFKLVSRIGELKLMSILIIVSTILTSLALINELYFKVGESFRIALFNILSAVSTTGYSTVSYVNWPSHLIGLLILLMIIGGGLGSTAGGIKLNRIYLLYRVTIENLRKRMSSSRKISSLNYYRPEGKMTIGNNIITDIIGFISIYLFVFFVGSFSLAWAEGSSLSDALFEFASALGTVGLSIGITDPSLSVMGLIILIIGMILGRLEIFIVIIGIYSGILLAKQKFSKG
ncbi:TrkH family potassium uptake protein [Amphibacillus jilinensis]|uniref:TrkH family potassium uptake protein n=1 Tax=Amphibacillus jilinensis TaxID=1216008 RepID=UPI0002EE091F|nr:potassium transporter TrkG [Amphibacillus jilinensis]